MEVLPGNAPDNLGALELVERSEANTGVPVEESLGDAAYGDGNTRQAFAAAVVHLVAALDRRRSGGNISPCLQDGQVEWANS